MMQVATNRNPVPELAPEVCRRARKARDPRFDGLFFTGVRTTGIYCRPICPARSPAEKNVRYYPTAALAAADGFRPCLRCRPESAPRSPAWRGTSTTVHRALSLIEQGAFSQGGVAGLDDAHFPMPGRRRDALRALATACIDREWELDAQTLEQVHGIGPWTLAMVGMRGFADPDAFPLTDLGVVKAWRALATTEALGSRMARWKPWRAYAANLLWRSLSP